MSKTILEMANITKEFPGVKALDDVTFKVDKGQIMLFRRLYMPLNFCSIFTVLRR